MYKIEVNQTLCRIIEMFYRFGMWQNDDEYAFLKIGKKLFYILFWLLFLIFILTNAFLCDDMNESIFLVEIVIMGVVMHVKLMYLLFKKEKILEFLYDPIVAHSTQDRLEWSKIKKFMKFTRIYFLTLAITYVANIAVQLPAFSNNNKLPFFVSFPWQSEIIYWMAYAFVTLVFAYGIIINSITVLIWYIMLGYSIEYEALGDKFQNLGMKSVTNKIPQTISKSSSPRNLIVKELIALIKHHQNLFKYAFSG